nr:hypothetical protein [Tanacetum cinerariifolium]
MDIHGSLREGDDTRVNLDELHSIMQSFKGTIAGLQQDTTVRVYPNLNYGFVDSTIENTDHELGGPTYVPKLTLQNLKSVSSTYDSGWNSLMDLKSATPNLGGDLLITKPNEVSPSDPIVKSVDIHEKPRSYLLKRLVHVLNTLHMVLVEYYARSNWAKHRLKRIMMNTKGFFFFKFDSRAGLEAVLEDGPWLIRKSLIIRKKLSMDTRLLKEELTRILIWVKLHNVPIQVFEEDDISLIATFISKPVILDSYTSSIETIHVEYEWRPPKCDVRMIFGHLHDHFPKKEVSPPIVYTSNVVTRTVEKTNDGFQTVGKKKKRKAATSVPKKGVTKVGNSFNFSSKMRNTGISFNKDNITSPNSFSTLNIDEEEEEDEEQEVVENMYDETANIFPYIKTCGSSSFMAAAG